MTLLGEAGVGTTVGQVFRSVDYKRGTAAGDANDHLIYNPPTEKPF